MSYLSSGKIDHCFPFFHPPPHSRADVNFPINRGKKIDEGRLANYSCAGQSYHSDFNWDYKIL